MWWKKYESLDLLGGTISFIGDDLEDMIEISYPDGMFIDAGKYGNDYCITVLPSNDTVGWNSPLAEIIVSDKNDLPYIIQKTIVSYRKNP